MSKIEALEQRIKERLAVTEDARQLRELHLKRHMQEFEQRHQQYAAIANRLMAQVIRPRMQKLAEHFKNATCPQANEEHAHHCQCRLEHTDRFPATAQLELAVSHDGDYETVQVLYQLSILPTFFAFKGKDQLAFPQGAVDEAKVTAWVDDRLIEFVDAYLRLEVMDQYQRDNQAHDPVCGMWVNKATASASMRYKNQMYYFCLDECRQKFVADPEHYLALLGPQR
jgi:YHS domain-containing protein